MRSRHVVRRGLAAAVLTLFCLPGCGVEADLTLTGPSVHFRIAPSGDGDGADSPVADAPTDAERPRLVARTAEGKEVAELPLVHTKVRTDVSGNVARVELEHLFENPLAERLEAIYTFPLPENAAVTDMRFRIGTRTIYSEVRTRDDARAVYEVARRAGRAAVLTEEERPNLFTERVANVAPGERIAVTLRYVHEVRFDDGRWVYVFPMTVGPRYIPGAPLAGPPAGPGWAPDTDAVPDGSRISPPFLLPDHRSRHEVDLEVRLHPAGAFADLRSRNHGLLVSGASSSLSITLDEAPEDRIANRDFVLEYGPASREPEPFLAGETRRDDEYVMLFVEPPAVPAEEMVRPREMVFLVDVSGSTYGYPLDTAKGVVTLALQGLRPDDTFQIIGFAGDAVPASPAPLPATPENVARGLADLGAIAAGGGTEMLAGIEAALRPSADPARLRIVVFLTDGFIGNEAEIIAAVDALRGSTRVMAFGIGAAPNRYLIDCVAEAGRGAADYVALGDDPGEAADRLHRRLHRPLLTDIELDWGGAPPEEAYPARIPDLFAGQPLVVVAKARRGEAPLTGVTVRARLGAEPYERHVSLARLESSGEEPLLGTVWARRKIHHLEHERSAPREAAEAITALGLEFKLVTPFTSLVAVDTEPPADPDLPLRSVTVPTELPEGTSPEGIFGTPVPGPAGSHAKYDRAVDPRVRSMGFLGLESSGGGAPPMFGSRHKGAEGKMGKKDSPGRSGLAGEGTIGLDYGGLDTVGKGGGAGAGSGAGHGRGAGSLAGSRAIAPDLIPGAPVIRGALDKEVIRRVIRKHKNELKYCYEKALVRKPKLGGKLVLRFVIAPTGAVARAAVHTSTLGDEAVAACVVEKVLAFVFPATGSGGVVQVEYPFVFAPGAATR